MHKFTEALLTLQIYIFFFFKPIIFREDTKLLEAIQLIISSRKSYFSVLCNVKFVFLSLAFTK